MQKEDAPALPGYQPGCLGRAPGLRRLRLADLIALWRALNVHVLAAAVRIPSSALARTCTIAGSQPMTLEFVIEDYIDHMIHHLEHIGLSLAEFRRPESAYVLATSTRKALLTSPCARRFCPQDHRDPSPAGANASSPGRQPWEKFDDKPESRRDDTKKLPASQDVNRANQKLRN